MNQAKAQRLNIQTWIEVIDQWLDNGYDMNEAINRLGRECRLGIKAKSEIINHFTA